MRVILSGGGSGRGQVRKAAIHSKRTREPSMNLRLIYVDLPFWRAEVSRVTLHIGGIAFEDRRITSDEFQKAKETGYLLDGTRLPFHQIPCLIADGVSIAQTGGIARFCGKLAGLYPKDDDLKAAQIDQFVDLATDLNIMVSKTSSIENPSEKIAARKELADGLLARKLAMLERCIPEGSDWIIGPQITIADVAIWRLLGWFTSGILDGLPTDLLKNFPKIRQVCLAVDSHPKVCDWIARNYPENYNRGQY